MTIDAAPGSEAPTNFIRNIINDDRARLEAQHKVVTRFPPHPNGYLHIGHAKSIFTNFQIAKDYKGICYLRFDDTNPEKQKEEYTQAIMADVRWLGYDWEERLTYCSDYFEQFYGLAVKLIKAGKAYVCSLSSEQVREYRGTLSEPGRHSPDRDRSIEDNLDLFARMKAGEFADGRYTLRAKIDMASGNINFRDPTLYRIKKATHDRTGDDWAIYPMYDFSHPLNDAFEGITYSLCTLEFQDHRPLYDWMIEQCETEHRPRQIEFSRLNLSYTITSKRKLAELVSGGHVSGWDDPRMPTISGFRRRGCPPEAILKFCERIGLSKKDTVIDISVLEEEMRNALNDKAPRAMAVLEPLKITLTNFAECFPGQESLTLSLPNHPQKPELGRRDVAFGPEVYIERADFTEEPPPKYKRFSPQTPVRLRYGFVISLSEIVYGDDGEPVELRCQLHPETLGGKPLESGKKVKGIVHWVSGAHMCQGEVRVYDRLFKDRDPGAQESFLECLNPGSLITLKTCYLDSSLAHAAAEQQFQFERLGYFTADRHDHASHQPVFNRTVTLRDTWSS